MPQTKEICSLGRSRDLPEVANLRFSIMKKIKPALTLLLLALASSVWAQQSVTLDESLTIAMDNSPDIQRLKLLTKRSQEMLNAQNARLKSQFSLSLTPLDYSKEKQFNYLFSTWYSGENTSSSGTFTLSQPIKWTDGTLSLNNRFSWQNSYSEFRDERDKSYSNNLFLNFDQPIFTYNRTKLALRELELDLENANLNFEIQRLALERNVTRAFYDIYAYRMSLQIAEEEFENQQISYDIIKNKVDAGLAAKEELYQGELNLAQAKSSVQNGEVTYQNALDAFKRLIGMNLENEITVMADITHQEVPVDLNIAIEHGLAARMELRQRAIDIETSQFSLIQSSAMNEFRGNISLSYGLLGNDERSSNIYEKPAENQRVSLSLDIPLFDWGEKKSRIAAAEAVVETNELGLETEKTDIKIGIRTVYRNLINLINQIEIARQSERNAQLTYDINLERYKNGDLTSMDLSLFQNQLSQSKMNLVTALIDYKIELLNMKIQSLWDFEENQPVVSVKLDG